MKASAQEEQIIQYCGFVLGEGYYAIPVLEVQEVVKPQIVTPIPLAQEHIRGLINLRGQIVTSVSLRKLFNLEDCLDADHMNIIVKSKESLNAFVVDEIMDVIDVDSHDLVSAPETIAPHIRKYIDSVYKTEDKLILLINLEKIFKSL